MLSHSLTQTKTGLPVITIPMPGVESVTVLVLTNTGSRYETPAQEGIAHFLEHMVFKGTENYPDAQTLAKAVDAIGADVNAFTSKEYTGYYVKAAGRHVETALDVVSDMLLTPHLRQEDIDREKGVIIEEINMYEDTPMRLVGNRFEEMFFAGSGLSHDIIGSKETVSSLKTKDFQDFLSTWYGSGNMLLVMAGNADVVGSLDALKRAEELFDKGEESRRGVKKTDVLSEMQGVKSVNTEQRLKIVRKTTEQAHLVLGWPAFDRRDPRRFALTVLSTLMGGNMSSRLFTEVREKRGLCYYVHADADFYHDAGIFGASAGVDPNRIDEALEVIATEFAKLADGSQAVTEQELEQAKEYISGKMSLRLEDSRSVAQFFGMKQLLHDEIETPDQVLDKIRSVSLEEAQKLAAEIVRQGEMRLAIVGQFEDEGRFEKFLM